MGRRFIDLTGERFEKWLVMSRAQSDKNGITRWLCRCDCGRSALVYGISLKSGRSRSCGCAHGRRTIADHRSDAAAMVGSHLGLLEVTSVCRSDAGIMLNVMCHGCGRESRIRKSDARTRQSCADCARKTAFSTHPRHPTVTVACARGRLSRGWSLEAACAIPKGARTK
jgi:hypothetical protein